MILLLFFVLAGCAVKCDDSNNYYVIQMVDDPPKLLKKPFRIYWNVPTMQCRSKRIPFENLYEKYGIIQNKNDSFRGEKIAILYDPGSFPALLKNDTSGKYEFRNGGVPQEGDLDVHLAAFRSILKQSIPDSDFSGIGIIDFESWRPVFRQNFGALVPYKDVSYQIERNKHWMWPTSWIKSEAKKRFEEHARIFMQTTISVAKEMRPRALWGYYGFPYCFNMASNNMVEQCADRVPTENDYTHWLWQESTALYPSLYSSKGLSTTQLSQLVRGRVKEAARVRSRGTPILPYFWFRYRDGGYLSEDDLQTALKTIYDSDASGFIIWGSSGDVNTVEKCENLSDYINKILGPIVSKYARINRHHTEAINDETDLYDTISDIIDDATTLSPIDKLSDKVIGLNISKISENPATVKPPLKNIDPDLADPDFAWNPPENYTQDIIKYVQEEFYKKNLNKTFKNEKNSFNNDSNTILLPLDESKLIELMVKTLTGTSTKDPNEDIEDTTDSFTKPETKGINKAMDIMYAIFPDDSKENIGTESTEPNTFSTNYDEFNYKIEISNITNELNTELGEDTLNVTEPTTSIVDYSEDQPTTERFDTNFGEFKEIDYDFTTTHDKSQTTDRDELFFGTTERAIYRDKYDEKGLKGETELMEDATEEIFILNVSENKKIETSTSIDYVDFFKRNVMNDESANNRSEKTELMENATEEDFILKVTENINFETSTSIDYVDFFKGNVMNDESANNRSEKLTDSSNINDTLTESRKQMNNSKKSTIEQVAGSARYSGPKYFCLIFYFFSVSKCLCDYYGQC